MPADSLNKFPLEDIAALNDEIIMLSRAGVPLEPGLRKFAADGQGRANEAAKRLAERLESGKSLPASIREEGGQFPDLYATLVESGVRTGRLPVALETMSEFSREFVEVRRSVFQSMLYPLITVIAAYTLFLVFITNAVDQMRMWDDLVGGRTGRAMRILNWCYDNMALWVWIFPAVLIVCVLAWLATGRANVFSLGGSNRFLRFIPGMSRVVQYFRHSLFARMASVLIENDVPLPDALPLAAGACGKGLQQAALTFANADERGRRHDVEKHEAKSMRPLLRWILRRQQSGDRLISSLQAASRSYHEKGKARLRWIRFAAPLLFTMIVGGGLTAVYAMGLFMPLADMLDRMAMSP